MASEKTLSLTVPERIDVIKDSSDGNFFFIHIHQILYSIFLLFFVFIHEKNFVGAVAYNGELLQMATFSVILLGSYGKV